MYSRVPPFWGVRLVGEVRPREALRTPHKAHLEMWLHNAHQTPQRLTSRCGGTQAHRTRRRLTLFSSRSRTMQDVAIHYGTLEGGHRTLTKAWGKLHNLIGGSQVIATKASQSLRDLHNLIGAPRTPQRSQSRLGFQEPKSNKLTTFTYRFSEENSNRCT